LTFCDRDDLSDWSNLIEDEQQEPQPVFVQEDIPSRLPFYFVGLDSTILLGEFVESFIDCRRFIPYHEAEVGAILSETGSVSVQLQDVYELAVMEFQTMYGKAANDIHMVVDEPATGTYSCLDKEALFQDMYGVLTEFSDLDPQSLAYLKNNAICTKQECTRWKDTKTIFGIIIQSKAIDCPQVIENSISVCTTQLPNGQTVAGSNITLVNSCGVGNTGDSTVNTELNKSRTWWIVLASIVVVIASTVGIIFLVRRRQRRRKM
jgi:hypothetical protein